MYTRYLKPFMDFTLAILLLPILLPIFLAVFFILFFTNQGKVFFVQIRPGYKGKPFRLFKFRTLKDTTGTDEERATLIGRILRKIYLDELPQILNILKGEMSWVGPRPLLMEYMQIYTPQQHQRHQVKPGITGLAQIKENKNAPLNEKIHWDLLYVQHISFTLDMKILGETFKHLINTHKH
ncbi:MAG: sugar transferase [Raineya sp.]